MKITIKKDEQYGYVLMKEGKESFCPFQAPAMVPVQTAMGGMSMNLVRMPCSSNCPLAKYDEQENRYSINCGSEIKHFNIEEADDEIQDDDYGIIRKL